MAGGEDAREVVQKLHALGGGPLVVQKAAARVLARLEPTDATWLLRDLIRLAREGSEAASCVLPAFTRALELEAEQIPYAVALRRVASVLDLDEVALLFTDEPPRQEYQLEAARKADSKLFSQPLGRLKQLARVTRNPDELAKLAVASEPTVIRNVLINPLLTEALVVRIAARRPARSEPLVEIWRSARWSVRPMVRKALVFNPYFPTEVAVKIVPLLSVADLGELAEDRAVHPMIRLQAQVLLKQIPRVR